MIYGSSFYLVVQVDSTIYLGMKMAKTENISLMRKQLFITVLFF